MEEFEKIFNLLNYVQMAKAPRNGSGGGGYSDKMTG